MDSNTNNSPSTTPTSSPQKTPTRSRTPKRSMASSRSANTTPSKTSKRDYPRLTGWLMKRGEVNRAWKQRFCTVVDGKFAYAKTEDKSAIAHISLSQCTCRPAPPMKNAPCDYLFEIVAKHRIYQLGAKTAEEMWAWIDAISACSELHRENRRIERAEEDIGAIMETLN